jgi:hypothetical protein
MLLNTMNAISKFNLSIGKNNRLVKLIIIINATMTSVRVMLVVSQALNRDALTQMFASLHLLNVDVAVTLKMLLQYKKNMKVRFVVSGERLIYFRKTFENKN